MSAQYSFLSFAPCPIKENGVTMQIFRRVCLCERASQKTIRHEASQGHIHFVDVFTLMDTLQPHGLQLSRSSMGFLWQEYWSGLPFPPPGNLPNPRTEPMSPVAPALIGRFFTTEPPGSPQATTSMVN